MEGCELVTVENLIVQRGSFKLEVPEWRVREGTVVGVVGSNGAGKTTLLEMLPGFRRAKEGRVRCLGLDPMADPVAVRTQLGFMSDQMPVFALGVGTLLRLLSGYYATWDANLVETLLERFELNRWMQIRDLSRGEGTRLRLITALAFCPRVLVLDEPASGLDLAGRLALLETVLEVVRNPCRSVIISSHMLSDLERITDRLLVLHRGRVVKEGVTAELVGEGRTLEEALVEWGVAGRYPGPR